MICTSATSYRRKKWVVAEVDEGMVARLANEVRVPAIVARLLVQTRDHDRGRSGFFPATPSSPICTDRGRCRIWRLRRSESPAPRQGEKITLFGDYDVDGITGTAMLWHLLKTAGANVDYYIPHRVDEGYGLNAEAVAKLIDSGTRLLVTIDCGCSAVGPIAPAQPRGGCGGIGSS